MLTCDYCGALLTNPMHYYKSRLVYNHHFCDKECRRRWDGSRTMGAEEIRQYISDRSVADPSGCILWTGTKGTGGYGFAKIAGIRIAAHRLSYQMFKGEIPEGLDVLHTCDVPPCINPEHLYCGTDKDNSNDAFARGRILRINGRLASPAIRALAAPTADGTGA